MVGFVIFFITNYITTVTTLKLYTKNKVKINIDEKIEKIGMSILIGVVLLFLLSLGPQNLVMGVLIGFFEGNSKDFRLIILITIIVIGGIIWKFFTYTTLRDGYEHLSKRLVQIASTLIITPLGLMVMETILPESEKLGSNQIFIFHILIVNVIIILMTLVVHYQIVKKNEKIEQVNVDVKN